MDFLKSGLSRFLKSVSTIIIMMAVRDVDMTQLKMFDGISGPMKSLSGGAPRIMLVCIVSVSTAFLGVQIWTFLKYGLFQFLKSCMMMASTTHTVEPRSRWDLRNVFTD
eukprot:COSAG05_NODE_464_length_9544_cov_2.541345_6_plen_109_part_00